MEFAGHCTCVCALDAVRNIQGASRWAAKAHSQEWLCHGTPGNPPSLLLPVGVNQPSPSLRDSRGENSDRVVTPGLSTCICALWRQWGTLKGLPPGRKNAQPGMAVPRTQHFMLG